MNNKKIEKKELLKNMCEFVGELQDSMVDIKYFENERDFTEYIFKDYTDLIKRYNYDFSNTIHYCYELSNILDIIEDSNIPVNSNFIMRNDRENGILYILDIQADLNEVVDFISGDERILESKHCYYREY